jgi:RNA recognition motif-containing protein
MATKLYVGNLPYSVTDAKLKDIFSQAGTVSSASIILDRSMGNRSKGFGFVEMENDADAQNAISMFNDKDMEGRKLVVNVARPPVERAPRTGGYNRGGDRGGRNW